MAATYNNLTKSKLSNKQTLLASRNSDDDDDDSIIDDDEESPGNKIRGVPLPCLVLNKHKSNQKSSESLKKKVTIVSSKTPHNYDDSTN